MNARKLLISLLFAGLFLVGFGSFVLPASADTRYVVTLVSGETVQIDVPDGQTVEQVVGGPVLSATPVSAPAPAPAGAPAPPVSSSTAPAPPAATPSDATPTDEPGTASKQHQATSPEAKSNARPEGEGSGDGDAAKDKTQGNEKGEEAAADPHAPSPADPGFALSLPGPAPIGVPNFFIDKFRIPPFLLPIYQAAGIEYGVRWEVLAAINEIETDYGRNLNVSSAGALGWMQFIPSSWKMYGVDANRDGSKDPYNPVDAIFAAARYLKAAGADRDLRRAIFAYNHADWYVDTVLMRARLIGGLPADLVGSLERPDAGALPGARQGPLRRRPLGARGDQAREEGPQRRAAGRRRRHAPRDPDLREGGLPGRRRPGRQDRADGLDRAPRPLRAAARRLRQHLHVRPPQEARPRAPGAQAADGHARRRAPRARPPPPRPRPAVPGERRASRARASSAQRAPRRRAPHARAPPPRRTPPTPPRPWPRSASSPTPTARAPSAPAARSSSCRAAPTSAGSTTFNSYFTELYGLKRKDVVLRRLKPGSKVIAGTILGRIGTDGTKTAPHTLFEIRPAGRDAPRIDPKPILDGWKLLESTAIYRAAGKNPFFGPDADNPSIGQILLMSKEALQRRVLTNASIEIYECGRRDMRAGGDRPPRPRDARVPRRQRPEADGHLAALRPRLLHGVGQRLRTTRRATPSTSRRSTASRSSATRARARSPTSRSGGC